MLKFKRVSYKNFLSTGNVPNVVDLDRSSTTLIVGENGCGKSSLLDSISFALFGKAHRDIRIPQLLNSINNKNLLVECDFEIGSNKYTVRRGIKPAIFEIIHNGKLLNQESRSRDYQKILENNILKLNHKSFHQIVVLGSSNFIPFMQLRSNQRRGVIEDLLDINIFTKMNVVVREHLAIIKSKIAENERIIESLSDRISLKESHIRSIESMKEKDKLLAEKKRDQIADEIAVLEVRNAELDALYQSSFPDLLANDEKLKSIRDKLSDMRVGIASNKERLLRELNFYKENDNCPTCSQSISLQLKAEKGIKNFEKISELEKALDSIKDEISKKESDISTNARKMNEAREHLNDIRNNQSLILRLSNELTPNYESPSESIDLKGEREELNKSKVNLLELFKEKNEDLERRAHLDACYEMLKDSGIKTKVIKEYLPVMNKLINKYLSVLDFFVLFNLDESFNETIKSRHRDEFSYASFSEGEKSRIDLALLFSWREIAKMKNSTNTNLLILDETMDASLDAEGVENLLKILYGLKDSNIFVISHKRDIMEGKFESRIEFEKVNNFSRIKA